MSKLALALLIVCVTADRSYAEEPARPMIDTAVEELNSFALQTGVGRTAPPGGSSRHCCNKKGVLIGAAVGAAFGLWVAHYCDYDCAGPYIGAASLFGGVGAAIGAFANANPRVAPFPDRRVRIAGVISPTRRAVLATVRLGRPMRRAASEL